MLNILYLFEPVNKEIKVWRYLDFTKLVSLLDNRSLYFTRADNFEDKFEESWPKANVDARKPKKVETDDINFKNFYTISEASTPLFEQWRRFVAINSWHMNDYESAAMWKLYLKSDEGVAIRSTYQRL
jgi:hypothetical protein